MSQPDIIVEGCLRQAETADLFAKWLVGLDSFGPGPGVSLQDRSRCDHHGADGEGGGLELRTGVAVQVLPRVLKPVPQIAKHMGHGKAR